MSIQLVISSDPLSAQIRKHKTARYRSIPVAVRYVCGGCIAGIAGSNFTDGMDARLLCLLFAVCCEGSGLWNELITSSEESYRVRVCVCVCVCVFECL